MWMKWWHIFADGPSEDIHWRDMSYCNKHNIETEIKELCYELRAEFDWSEHYRGVKYEIVENAPSEIIMAQFEKAMKDVEAIQARADSLHKLIMKLENEHI